MKKNKWFRILSFMFCFVILLFAGCDASEDALEEEGATGISTQSLSGAKVLSRPANYSFSEAVGTFSEHYYNLFARDIMNKLYEVYNAQSLALQYQPQIYKDLILQDAGGANYQTYGALTGNNQYYLYDSPRYTVTKIETVRQDGDIVKQVLHVEDSSAWNWSILPNTNITGKNTAIIFKDTSKFAEDAGKYTIDNEDLGVENWFEAGINGILPNYGEFYFSDDVVKKDPVTGLVNDYYKSPYYQQYVEGATVTLSNYFQDALEYVTYMFVLGYDYAKLTEEGEVERDAGGKYIESNEFDYFDFEITKSATTGVTAMSVGGWGANKISVAEALNLAKNKYQEIGGYVGVVDKNIDQLTRFVLDIVIGQNAYARNVFELEQKNYLYDFGGLSAAEIAALSDAAKEGYKQNDPTNAHTSTKFHRNYDAIVRNVIANACKEAPIGESDGAQVTLENNFVASQISDYTGDYFFMAYDADKNDPNNDGGSDKFMFKNIEAAEYQSIVLFPMLADLNKPLTDIWLAFEYFDNPDPTKTMLDELTINVGFRYFSCDGNGGDGKLLFDDSKQMKIKKGQNGTLGGDPDENWFYICDTDTLTPDLKIGSDVVVKTLFNNSIGNNCLNPFVSSLTPVLGRKASKTITGLDNARQYYKLNDSKSYGQYGTLNEAMFSRNKAGNEACDFMEVYFDIVKDKNASNVSYNFKVGLLCYATEQPV